MFKVFISYNCFLLLIFLKTQRHNIDVSIIDVSIYVTTLKALQCAKSQTRNTLVFFMLRNELYPSRFAKNKFIGHRI